MDLITLAKLPWKCREELIHQADSYYEALDKTLKKK